MTGLAIRLTRPMSCCLAIQAKLSAYHARQSVMLDGGKLAIGLMIPYYLQFYPPKPPRIDDAGIVPMWAHNSATLLCDKAW